MNHPEISVIMAVYNGEAYLTASIESVLNQSYHSFEFIIVDDCSSDTTADIIQSYRDERIIYLRNHNNLGQTPSLNIGLRKARGKYLARIDADDIYLPGKLIRQYDFMEEHPDIAVSGTAGIKIDDAGKEIGLSIPPLTEDKIAFSLFYRSPLIHVSVMMKASIIKKYGGYDERYPYCADFALWSSLIRNHHRIANIPDVLIQYREFSGTLGARTKLGQNSAESARIIQSNFFMLARMNVSEKQCRDIVLLFWPNVGLSLTEIGEGYMNLTNAANAMYHGLIPKHIKKETSGIFLWSLIKRALYQKARRQLGSFWQDIAVLYRDFHGNCRMSLLIILARFISFSGEQNIMKLRKFLMNRHKSHNLNPNRNIW